MTPSAASSQSITAELADALRRPRRLAQQMACCLRHVGVLEAVGKKGNAIVYSRGHDLDFPYPRCDTRR
ncbi:MAG: hypothetical protein VYE73_08420 [Acidobacteriota bacterium]|nr:hypothetical protein [Acidobacteriota bacterium]